MRPSRQPERDWCRCDTSVTLTSGYYVPERGCYDLLARLSLGVPLEPVVRQRLPLARVLHERVPLRTDVVAGIEEAEPHTPDLARLGRETPERAAALRAEALRPAVLRLERL